MRPNPDNGIGLNRYGSAGTSEGLFVDMTVQQHTTVEQLAFFAHHFPPVGVLLAARVGAAYANRELIGSGLTRDLQRDHVGLNADFCLI